jgi:WD40 repeat protein
MPINTHPSYGLSFSSDGNCLLTRTDGGGARVWNAHSGQLIMPLLARVACFSPDGQRIITAGGRMAHLFDAATGKRLTRPLEHRDVVAHAAFSPDGRRVVTASDDHTARIWDTKTGLPLTPPLQHQDQVTYAEFSPDGRRIVTACADGMARVWEFEATDWPVKDLRLLAELLSGRTIDETGSFSTLEAEALRENFRQEKARQPEYFSGLPAIREPQP